MMDGPVLTLPSPFPQPGTTPRRSPRSCRRRRAKRGGRIARWVALKLRRQPDGETPARFRRKAQTAVALARECERRP
jgi:hypothetical protein